MGLKIILCIWASLEAAMSKVVETASLERYVVYEVEQDGI